MEFNDFMLIRNARLLNQSDIGVCVFSCSIVQREKNSKYRELFIDTDLPNLIKKVRSRLYIKDLILHRDDIKVYCFNPFWRDIYNPLSSSHEWIKKEFIFSPTLTKIKLVTTYYKDSVCSEKINFRGEREDVSEINGYEYTTKCNQIDLKYADKLYRTEHAVYINPNGESFGTFEEALDKVQRDHFFNEKEKYLTIHIYDPTISDNPVIDRDQKYSLDEIKQIASRNCVSRRIEIDRYKKKILCEYFENYEYFAEFRYDYGILYGGIELDYFRKYKSISGYSLGDSGEMIFEGMMVVQPINRGELKDIINPENKLDIKEKSMFVAEGFFYDADEEDYYNAFDSVPGIIPVEDLVPAYDYDKYDKFEVHVGTNWEESDKFKGETKEYPFYYKQEFFVKELVGVTNFLTFTKVPKKLIGDESDEALFETKYAYIKLFNDNGNVTIYMDRVRGIYLDFDKGGDLVFMIPKKKEEA